MHTVLWQVVVTAWHRSNTNTAGWPTFQWSTWEDQPISSTAGEISGTDVMSSGWVVPISAAVRSLVRQIVFTAGALWPWWLHTCKFWWFGCSTFCSYTGEGKGQKLVIAHLSRQSHRRGAQVHGVLQAALDI